MHPDPLWCSARPNPTRTSLCDRDGNRRLPNSTGSHHGLEPIGLKGLGDGRDTAFAADDGGKSYRQRGAPPHRRPDSVSNMPRWPVRRSRHETVSAPGHTDDIPGTVDTVAQSLPHGHDLGSQIALIHVSALPHRRQKLPSFDDVAWTPGERDQHVERPLPDPDRLAFSQEFLSRNDKPEWTEVEFFRLRPIVSIRHPYVCPGSVFHSTGRIPPIGGRRSDPGG